MMGRAMGFIKGGSRQFYLLINNWAGLMRSLVGRIMVKIMCRREQRQELVNLP